MDSAGCDDSAGIADTFLIFVYSGHLIYEHFRLSGINGSRKNAVFEGGARAASLEL